MLRHPKQSTAAAQRATTNQLLLELQSPTASQRRRAADQLGHAPAEARVTAALTSVAAYDSDQKVRRAASRAVAALKGVDRNGRPIRQPASRTEAEWMIGRPERFWLFVSIAIGCLLLAFLSVGTLGYYSTAMAVPFVFVTGWGGLLVYFLPPFTLRGSVGSWLTLGSYGVFVTLPLVGMATSHRKIFALVIVMFAILCLADAAGAALLLKDLYV